MNDQKIKKIAIKQSVLEGGVAFIAVFIVMFVFFRYIHPIVPWEGDDWGTLGPFITTSEYGFPIGDEYEQIMPAMLATLMGYIAAFVVYPITGNYIAALTSVNAIALAITIAISIVAIYQFIRNYFETKIHVSLIGISFFLAFAFLMFKTHPNSQYLYWQYDLCVTYYYSIPNYLATALFLYLYTHRTSIENKNLKPIKNGFIVAAIYLLTFSFMPAACVIAANSFWRLFELICKTKDIKQSAKQGWCYIISLVFFCMLIYFEFGRTFGTGYLNSDVSFVNKISVAFLFIIETFGKLHPMVKIFSIIIIVSAVWIAIRKYMRREICELDSKYFRFVWMTGRVIFVLLVYLTLLGSVSMGHLSREIIEIRMDTMYSFYSLLLLLVVVCLMYIIHQNSKAVACIPMILLIMAYPILSHKNYFSSSMYMDSTPAQRYEIMSEIVQEAKRQDRTGEINIIAHIPYGTNPYGMPMLQTLQVHDIVSHGGVIEFVYDPESDFYME